MNRQLFYFLLLFSNTLFSSRGHAQNLVKDPGFEMVKTDYWEITSHLMQDMVYWRSPTLTTPDVIRKVDSTSQSPQYKFSPRNGKTVAGIYTYIPATTTKYRNFDYREYVRCPLTQKLKPGKKYYVELWVTVLENWNQISNNIGVGFTHQDMSTLSYLPLLMSPSVNATEIPEVTPGNWQKISGEFIAKDSFEYLIIGNFYNNDNTRVKNLNKGGDEKGCYYLVDDVMIQEKTWEEAPPLSSHHLMESLQKEFEVIDSNLILDEVSFGYNSADITESSRFQLDRLTAILKTHPNLFIRLKGHTDNSGSGNFNLKLSSRRAGEVFNYLVRCGISPNRLSFVGYGSSRPIADNRTTEGRARNRRVEFEIVNDHE